MDKVFPLIGIIYLLAVAWPLARIDIREHRLPNRLVLPAFPIIALGQCVAVILAGQWQNLVFSLLTGMGALVIGLLANHAAGLGMGDVKLIAAIAFALGWYSPLIPLVAVFVAFTVASVVILLLFAIGKSKLKSNVALGPYLLIGFAASLPTISW